MNTEDLPVNVLSKFIDFFNYYFKSKDFISFSEIFDFIEQLPPNDIDYIKIKFDEKVKSISLHGQSSKSNKDINDKPLSSVERMARYYALKEEQMQKDKIKTLTITSKKVSPLYVDILEREINNILDEEDYDFIKYIRNYMDSLIKK